MVRIISCHHFRGQRIGRCDEAVGLAVAGDTIIVALEHQINIYGKTSSQERSLSPDSEVHSQRTSPPPPLPGPGSSSGTTPTAKLMQQAAAATALSSNKTPTRPPPAHHGTHDIGTPFSFSKFPRRGSEPITAIPPSVKKDNKETGLSPIELDTSELGLSHSFPTIDFIHKISYNETGNYILCLEKRESASNSHVTNLRSYFHWEKDHGSKPMRARIAGLVSPTGAEPEEDSLMMVEIPLTSPATAISSCSLTGHIACLSAESIINIFLFRAKEVTGRVRVMYYDFDRTYAVEMPGFIPEQIYFVSNYLACMDSEKVHVFRVQKEEGPTSPQFASCSIVRETRGFKKDSSVDGTDKVVFNPRDETIKVYLPSIVRANRKRKCITSVNITDDFQEDIHENHTKIVFSATNPGISVEDMIRVEISNTSGNNHSKFLELGLYPVRMKDNLGAIALMICTKNEGFLYHLPTKPNCSVVRVASYPFTASLISFAFDSVFFHALTEAGLESYTSRSLYYAIKDQNGIKPFLNDCPLQEEPPTLAGIRPFVGVRKMACNSSVLCLLTCSNSNNTNNKHPSEEEQAWTIYTLDLPDINALFDDILKTASRQEDHTSETYMILLGEAYIALKLFMDSHPGSETRAEIFSRHKDICKSLGLAYLKSSVLLPSRQSSAETPAIEGQTTNDSTASPSAASSSTAPDSSSVSEGVSSIFADVSEDLINTGVTYLLMGHCGVQEVFSPENWNVLRELSNIAGFVRMVEVTFIKNNEFQINPDNRKLSPTLTPVLIEFLSNNSKQTLVDLVIKAPFIRESNSRRLLHILQEYAEATKETSAVFAVILTLVTIGGVDVNTRSQVKDLLHKTNQIRLSKFLTKDVLLETKGQTFSLTDLAICVISDEQSQRLIAEKMFQFLKSAEITLTIVMLVFSQAINVNTDAVLQHCITKCLITVLEKHISHVLTKTEEVEFTEEEKRAIQLLVRTYVSNINFSSNIPPQLPIAAHHTVAGESHSPNSTMKDGPTASQVFGNVCICVNFLLSIHCPGGRLTPQSQNLATAHFFMNEDSRENYIKLLSLLSNPVLSNMDGIKDIVLTYLHKNATQVKPGVNPTLYTTLQIFTEPPEKAVDLILTKQPTTILLFAKETFLKDTSKWQRLVTNLKHRIQNNEDSDLFATILESVYLHLANSLTPHELEQVLDKETEISQTEQKFHGISRRVELAKTYTDLVIRTSSNFLNHK